MPTYKLPVYLVFDVSASMGPFIGNLNEVLDMIIETLKANPVVADKVQLSVIAFSDRAYVAARLADVGETDRSPILSLGEGTAYGPVLKLLRETIPEDVRSLKAEGLAVYRPIVLFLTDGNPTDNIRWEEELHLLRKAVTRPNIIAIGIGEVDPEILLQLASRPDLAFLSMPHVNRRALIRNFGNFAISVLLSFISSSSAGATRTDIPTPETFASVRPALLG